MSGHTRRFETLDGWRGIAILLVTAFHTSQTIWAHNPQIMHFTQFGALGVDVFFGLSGLLITKLLLEERDAAGQISLKAFYIRRGFRVILPCYLYVTVVCALRLVTDRDEMLSSFLFFRNYLPASYDGPYTVHLWSLAVEEHFYLLWPPILVLSGRRYGRELAVSMSLACALWRLVGSQYIAISAFSHFRSDYRLDALMWGAVIAFHMHDSRLYADIKTRLNLGVWCGALTAFVLCFVFYSEITRSVVPMLIPLLLIGTLTHPPWRVSRILNSRFLSWIGRLSYSLYLWQLLFLLPSTLIVPSTSWMQRFPLNLVLTFAATLASYYGVEKPLVRFGRRLSNALLSHSHSQQESRRSPLTKPVLTAIVREE